MILYRTKKILKKEKQMNIYEKLAQRLIVALMPKNNEMHPDDKKFIDKISESIKEKKYNYLNKTRLDRLNTLTSKWEKEDNVQDLQKLYSSLGVKNRSKDWNKRVEAIIKKDIKEIDGKKISIKVRMPIREKERKDANAKAVALIKGKGLDSQNYDKSELEDLARFTGNGKINGDKNEYFTPFELADATWNLLPTKDGDKILDPSCGAGIFSRTSPNGVAIDGVDLNRTSASIADVLNPHQSTHMKSFEEYAGDGALENSFDGIITNVPFGERYKDFKGHDSKYRKITKADTYFILRSLDLLKEGKRGVFLTTSSTAQRASNRDDRLLMLKKGSFLGGYRLPSKMFEETGTSQVVDILIFEKHPDESFRQLEDGNYQDGNLESAIDMSPTSLSFLNGRYFEDNLKNIFGDFESAERQREEAEERGDKIHHHLQKDTVNNPFSIEELKEQMNYKIKNNFPKNSFGYAELHEILDFNESSSSIEVKRGITKELMLETEGLELNEKDFLDLYTRAKKNRLLNTSSFRGIMLKAIALENKNPDGEWLPLLDIFNNINPDFIENRRDFVNYYIDEKPYKKLRKSFSDREMIKTFNFLSANMTVEPEKLKDLNDENTFFLKDYKSFNYRGNKVFDMSSFTDEELAKDDVMIEADGGVIPMDDFIQGFNSMGFRDAMEKIGSLEKPSGVSDKMWEDKLLSVGDSIKPYRHVRKSEDLSFSLKMVDNYFGTKGYRVLSGVMEMGGDDIAHIFMSKIRDNYIKSREQIDKWGVRTESDFLDTRRVKSLLETMIKAYLGLDAQMRLSPYMRDVKDDKDGKTRISIVSGIYKTSFSEIRDLLKYYTKETILGDISLRQNLDDKLENESKVKKIKETSASDSEPLEELRGDITDELIGMARLYQNEDAREFSSSLKDTIAQDTGLGKSISMLMSILLAIRKKRAKRVLVLTPNSVVPKLEAEFRKFITDKWQDRILIMSTQTIVQDLKRMGSDTNIRIIIAPHNIVDYFRLKQTTLNRLTRIASTAGAKDIATPFYNLVGVYPQYKVAKAFFENTGIDAIFVDEQQAYKNGVESLGVRKAQSKASATGINMVYLSEYLRKSRGENNASGVVGVTATPFTSSPSEVLANMVITGGYLDDYGKPKLGFRSRKDFMDTFIKVEDVTTDKTNGHGKTTSKTFVGFESFDILKDYVDKSVRFRSAESEQSRFKKGELKVKPDYEIFEAKEDLVPEIAESFEDLALLNEVFKTSIAEKKINKGNDALDHLNLNRSLERTIGETFGFINKVRNLSNGADFANGTCRVIVKKGTNIDDIKSAIGDTKHFSFLLYRGEKSLSLLELDRLDLRKEIVNTNIDEDVDKALKRLAPDLIEHDKDHTYFNIYSVDDNEINSILNKLISAKLVDKYKIFNLDRYPKYKTLIANIKNEYERKRHSRQIIFSDQPILTQRIIGEIISEQIEYSALPKIKVHYFSEKGGLKKDKSNAVLIQDNFNESVTPDIMIYGKGGITGVDFNKNVSSVHLMNIAMTADIHHQAMGRGVRQGNIMSVVNIYKYFTTGTFDKFLDQLVSGKKDWISSLSEQGGDIESEMIVDTSSASQALSEALLMFGGQGFDHETMLQKYKEYQINETRKETAEIGSIKIKMMVKKIDKLISKKTEIGSSEGRFMAMELYEITKNIKAFAFKGFHIAVPNKLMSLSLPNSYYESISSVYNSAISLIDEIEAEHIAKEQKAFLLAEVKVVELREAWESHTKAIKDFKYKSNLKKNTPDEISLYNRKAEEEMKFRDNLARVTVWESIDSTTGGLKYVKSDYMERVESNYSLDTTEQEILDAIHTIYHGEFQKIRDRVENAYDQAINIDENITKAKMDFLSKDGDDDFNGDSLVLFEYDKITITEAFGIIRDELESGTS